MSITSALVLFAVIWFMVFLIAIPIRLDTQGDVGSVVPGTHASAPAQHRLKQKALISTGVAFVLWAAISAIIVSGKVSINDVDILRLITGSGVGETSE